MRSGTRTGLRYGLAVLPTSVAVAVLAYASASAGTLALAGVAIVAASMAVIQHEWELFEPVFTDAADATRRAIRNFQTRRSPSRFATAVAMPLAIATTGGLAYLLGGRGIIGLAVVGALAACAGTAIVARPLLTGLFRAEPTDVPAHSVATSGGAVVSSVAVQRVLLPLAIGLSGGGAWFLAGMGKKGLLAAVAAISIGAAFSIARNKVLLGVFGMTLSLFIVMHKSFSAIDLELSGGAVSMYITSFDVMIVLCYIIWIREGSFVADLRLAYADDRRRLLIAPLIGLLLALPSLLVAKSTLLGASELLRMVWMYLLFVFVAVRVRTRQHVQAILAALGVYACLQLVVVILQWKTGGVLGLGFLGVPTELGERVTNDGSLGRPFGTIIHPVFMGAVMGSLGALALGLGCTLRRSLSKLAALAVVPVCFLPLYLSHARASLVALIIVVVVQVFWAASRKWVTRTMMVRGAVVVALSLAALWPQISAKVSENFGTDHYYEEVRSRLELNDVAGRIIADSPVLGVGLNNFETTMGPYQKYGLIFADNPVHNLYLLALSETGIIGFAGFAFVGVSIYALAMRLARSRDPLHAGVGLGFAGVVGFLMLEEILGFSLRQDVPLAMFWLMAGLSLSCAHQGWADRTLARRTNRSGTGVPTTARRTEPSGEQRSERDGVGVSVPNRAVAKVGGSAGANTTTATDRHTIPPAPTRHRRTRRQWRPRRTFRGLRVFVEIGVVCLVGALLFASAGSRSSSAATSPQLRVVFSAFNRLDNRAGIFIAGPNGNIKKISHDDERVYSWPVWALKGTKILYTVRTGDVGSPEEIEIMNPDGSDVQQLTHLGFRTGQPKMAADGKSLIFTALSPNFRLVAIYRMDLDTLTVTNLSARTQAVASLDADPRFTRDGRIILAGNDGRSGPIYTLSSDGSKRTTLVSNSFYNTDPDMSPDGRYVAVASYRGPGLPGVGDTVENVQVRFGGWRLVVHDMKTGKSRLFNEGLDCTGRTPADPCTPLQPSAFQPRWSPKGDVIGYQATVDNTTSCICIVNADGTNPQFLLKTDLLSINWFDWAVSTTDSSAPLAFGRHERTSRLLLTALDRDGRQMLLDAAPDLSRWTELPIDKPVASQATTGKSATTGNSAKTTPLQPEKAQWSTDRSLIVFAARTPVPAELAPHPAPPKGEKRQEHFNLDDLSPTGASTIERSNVAELQVFLRNAKGEVRQLTDPWIEDWRDALPAGDLRGNSDPTFADNGRSVIFTSISAKTGESSVMKLDLQTGDVMSLTNATAGALKSDDDRPAVSDTRKLIAFSTTLGTSKEIVTVATDGTSFVRRTDDDWFDTAPNWSPDGESIVYSSYRRATQLTLADDVAKDGLTVGDGWVLVKVNLKTGKETVLTDKLKNPAFDPVWSPEGDEIAFVTRGPSTFDVWRLPAAGGTPVPIAVTPFINELHVSWR